MNQNVLIRIMERYIKEIENIRKILLEFYEKDFQTEREEFLENQRNKKLIENLIIKIHKDYRLSDSEKEKYIEFCIELLAENTGCQEDEEIAIEIIANLEYLNYNILSEFTKSKSTNRWE